MRQSKEALYRTAWSPTFKTDVKIDKAWQDSRGEWIFSCSLTIDRKPETDFLFRLHELQRLQP